MRLSRGGAGTALSTSLALSSATLSGGMQLAASGGGLPQRITSETPITFSSVFNVGGGTPYDHWLFDPDGIHIWTAHESSNFMKKRKISDQSVVLTVTPTGGQGNMRMNDYDGTYFYVGCYTQSKIVKVKYSDGSYTVSSSSNSTTAGWGIGISFTTNPTLAWGMSYTGGPLTEYTIGSTATGRTITGGASNVIDAVGTVEGGVGYIYYVNQTSVMKKVRESDLAVIYTWTFNQDSSSWPGHSWPGYLSVLSVDASTGTPYIYNPLNGTYLQCTMTGGTGAAAVTKVIAVGHPELRGPTASHDYIDAWRYNLAVDPTGRYWGFNTAGSANNSDGAITLYNKQLQRARFSNTFTAACTLTSINIPNYTGNSWDGSSAGLADQRRAIFYYALNGGSRTAFEPGAALTVAVAANDALTVDMDLIETVIGLGAAPYISGPLTLYYTPS